LLPLALSGHDPEAQREFARLWQARVRRILIDHFDDTELVRLALSSA
jgi:superfamily I DNA/RNA helicase